MNRHSRKRHANRLPGQSLSPFSGVYVNDPQLDDEGRDLSEEDRPPFGRPQPKPFTGWTPINEPTQFKDAA